MASLGSGAVAARLVAIVFCGIVVLLNLRLHERTLSVSQRILSTPSSLILPTSNRHLQPSSKDGDANSSTVSLSNEGEGGSWDTIHTTETSIQPPTTRFPVTTPTISQAPVPSPAKEFLLASETIAQDPVSSPARDDAVHEVELVASAPPQDQEVESMAVVNDDDDGAYPSPLTLTAQSPYAYAFLIGGCGPESPGYKGFLWGVMVSAAILRANGSTADFIALIQMAGSSRRLPPEEEKTLTEMNIRVQYLPPVTLEHSFYDAVLEKFRILQLTEYRRVLFMDADIMPLDVSLDYVFEASDSLSADSSADGNATNVILKPNVLRATRGEPANAGFFILEPGEGKWERLQEIIDLREINALKHKWSRNWDIITGWGADTSPEGGWKATHIAKKYGWKFWFAAADQGLLYYWAKYIEQNVTLMIGDTYENWVANPETGRPVLESSFPAPFDEHQGASMSRADWKHEFNCANNQNKTGKYSAFCHEPIVSLHHFYGSKKPWTLSPPADFRETQNDATRVFYFYLDKINTKYGIGLDFDDWEAEKKKIKNLPLGSSNSGGFWGDLDRRMQRRKPYLLAKAKEWNITIENDVFPEQDTTHNVELRTPLSSV